MLSLADRLLEETVAGGKPVSCRTGCTACCYYPLRVGDWEMALVLEAFRKLPARTRHKVKSTLERSSARVARIRDGWTGFPELEDDRLRYSRDRIKCPLLLEDRCVAYSVRPVQCRLHVVVSDPEQCYGGDKPVMKPRTSDIEAKLDARLVSGGLHEMGSGELLIDALLKLVG